MISAFTALLLQSLPPLLLAVQVFHQPYYHLCAAILTSRLLRMWLTCVFSHPSVWFWAENAFISPNAAYPALVSSRPRVVSHACRLIFCKFDEGVNTRLSPDQKTSVCWCIFSKSQLPSALENKLIQQGTWRASGRKHKRQSQLTWTQLLLQRKPTQIW